MAKLEKRYFHEGRVVSQNFENRSHIHAKFESIGFNCLLNINEQIVPRFVLEFYSQLTFTFNPEGHFVVNFVIQNKSFSLTLEKLDQILKIPFKGQASHTDIWLLDHLPISVPSKGHYKTTPPSPRVIKSFIQIPRQGEETCTKNKKTIVVGIMSLLIFVTCYCIETSTPYNLAFFILKRMEKTQSKPKELLPYGMLLTRLFKHIVSISPELAFDHYLAHDQAIDEDITTTPSPTTMSSSPTPPNALSKTTSTNQTSSSQENASSSFHSKLQISPPSSHELNSPPQLNPLLDNILDVSPRPLNPQPLQSHPSLDITLSLSPITLLDHTHDTTSPPSPP
ncbi:hypothetical protein Tco_0001394 [Tanacetum coccineum]